MANEEHIALLKQGAASWNQWRKNNPAIIPDLSRANLHNTDLSFFDLHLVNFSQANLSNTYLNQANLSKANLQGTNLLGANLRGANLQNANLNYAILRQTQIDSSTAVSSKARLVWEIVNQDAASKNLSGADLSQTNLFRVDFSNTDLSNVNLKESNLSGANFNNAYLPKANLERANLARADLSNAYLSHANLRQAILSETSLNGAYLRDADLQFVNLQNAQINRKTIIESKWFLVWEIVNRGAVKKNLSSSDLSNTNLRGVNFAEADLSNTNLSNSDLRGCCFWRANLSRANLRGANLCGADLREANLDKTNLQAAMSGAAAPAKRDRHTQFPSNFDAAKVGAVRAHNLPRVDEQVIEAHNQPEQKKKSFNWLLIIGITVLVALGGYLLWRWHSSRTNSFFRRPNLEQLIPSTN
ncbi:pentapeptide repeat-containing protein [Pleurocapsales cyanobacterium LEGE 06147]|nr:pentapeptide repeat-containing protein [Pleurocapsales cyanobacterium LEGE 06147]